MSKRWFDLLATIIFGVLLYQALNGMFIMLGTYGTYVDYNLREFGYALLFAIVGFALRRFFYNKEK